MDEPRKPMTGARKELLDQLVRRAAAPAPATGGIPPRAAGMDSMPPSYAQQRLWFLNQLDPEGRQYHIPLSWRLVGDLDADGLRAAFAALAARHEALRTRFVADDDGAPVQVIDPPGAPPLECVELTGTPPGEVRRRCSEVLWAPFDLGAGPCWRGLLARVGEREHVLALVFHHIVFDGWSSGVLQRDLAALYRVELGTGEPPAPLPLQYPDYALWEREELASGRRETLLAYWRERLRGMPEALELRTDRPRPDLVTHAGAVLVGESPPGLFADAARLGREEGASPFAVLLAAFAIVLARYAGQDDVVVGTVVANRPRAELERLIGFFVNSVPLRLDLSAAATFRAAVRLARDGTLGAIAHQELPLDALVEEVRPRRDLSRVPLFQVLFTLVADDGGAAWDLPGVDVRPEDPEEDTARFDLALTVRDHDGAVRSALTYATALFDADTAARLLDHVHHVLARGVADPDRSLSSVPLATTVERAALPLEGGADVPVDERTLHEGIQDCARRTPDAVALYERERAITYRELCERAEGIARHLVAAGVGADQPVGVCLERSAELVAGVLGILMAGGAFLPLEPGTPPARVRHMLREAGAGVCLTDTALVDGLPAGAADYVCADRLAAPPALPLPRGDADALVAVYFTSGSTGRPKGVTCHHRGWMHYLSWAAARQDLAPGDVTLWKTALTFDMTAAELFPPLLRGAAVAIGSPDAHRDPAAMADDLERYGVTTFAAVPSFMKLLLDELEDRGAVPVRVRFLWCAGEALTGELARRVHRVLGRPGFVLDNQYGPTEASITVSGHRVGSCDPIGHGGAPIGTPVWHTAISVLDRDLLPLPPGVPGELYVSGPLVARGYVGQPGLTAERFLPDPVATIPGSRMYRTGDVAWYRPDGTLEFSGRADHQVKVHGVRVEPGEIEVRLEQHPRVRRAVVVLHAERLVAYVEHTAGPAAPAPGHEELAAHLREFLPEPMVPSAFTVLDRLPVAPSGKVDRQALPAPAAAAASGHVAPSTETEQALAKLWAATLGVERVGVHDDFFALGGHSLSAVRLISAIRKRWGDAIPLRLVFEAPTVAALARRLAADGGFAGSGVVPLADGPARPPLALLHPLGGTVFCYRDLAAAFGGTRAVWGLEAPTTPMADLPALAAWHRDVLTSAQPEGPYALAGWSMGGVLAYEVARQLVEQGADVAALFVVDALPATTAEARAGLHATQRRLEELISRVEALGDDAAAPAGLVGQAGGLLATLGVSADGLNGYDRDDLVTLMRGWHANLAALTAYEPRAGDLHARVLVASEHDAATSDEITGAWRGLARRGCTVERIDGGHLTLLAAERAATLAERIRAGLDARAWSAVDSAPATHA